MYNSKIIGTGHFVPENIVTNDDLSKIMDTNDAWIQERTGIKERRHVKEGDGNTNASMAVKASKIAIDKAGLTVDDIDFIVYATISGDLFFPGNSALVQDMLGCKENIAALEVRNACSGFIYALSVADQFIKTGMYKNVLVIGAEVQTTALDLTTRGRDVSVLFGDGAGAVVLTQTTEERGILSTHLHAQGSHAKDLMVENPSSKKWVHKLKEDKDDISYFPKMNGREVFKHAVTRFPEVIMEGLEANNMQASDIDLFIPHQANLRISQFVGKKLGLPDEKVFNNIQKYGNTTAATLPIALDEALEEGRIKEGDTVVLAAFGAGFTWASAIIKW